MKGEFMGFKAVIFDMDGVLIDSEYLYLTGIHRELQKKRPWVREEDLYPSVGMDSARNRELMHRVAREPLDNLEFDRELEEIYSLFDDVCYQDILYPEVPDVLRRLREMGFKTALASSTGMEGIRKVLRQCGIGELFDYVVSGEQFRESKPNPEIYLTAMAALGCRAGECLVVEDSTYGVTAGVAAGACVAARRDSRFPFDQTGAAYRVDSLTEILELPGIAGQNDAAL